MNKSFPNCAGRSGIDAVLAAELTAAGIEVVELPFERDGEVKTCIMGTASKAWRFTRAWYYWIAEGPGIPPEYAEALHAAHGKDVRVDGHCGCPSPFEWHKGFAVGHYHVDTPDGLAALAATIAKVVADAQARHGLTADTAA